MLNDKLDALKENLEKTHAEEGTWAQKIMGKQANLEYRLGFDTTPRKFIPYYDPKLAPRFNYPEVYNRYGERMEFFFISERELINLDTSTDMRYIIWDRFNYGNTTHFYTHDEIFRTVGKPKRKFAMMLEPRSIKSQSYDNVLKNKDYVEKNFDMLFTFDAQLLTTLKNARFAPLFANVWYGMNKRGWDIPQDSIISPDNCRHKTKNISLVCSPKEMCPMHILRKGLAFKCKEQGWADTYGNFDGGAFVSVEKYLQQYRYSIVFENDISPYFFTEKIMNCFAAQTIPIYFGATEIDKFFNAEGIIQLRIEDYKHIEKILKLCTPEEYERRLPAVMDNFNRAMKFTTQTRFDEIYVKYIRDNEK